MDDLEFMFGGPFDETGGTYECQKCGKIDIFRTAPKDSEHLGCTWEKYEPQKEASEEPKSGLPIVQAVEDERRSDGE